MFLATPIVFLSLVSSPIYADVFTTSITTSGSVNIDVSTAGNSANVATDTVGIISTCPLGYDLAIAATSATNSSFSDTTLYKSGDSTSTSTISPSAGTVAIPATILGGNLGTWGYSLDSNTDINSNFVGLTNTPTALLSKATASATGGDQNVIYYGASIDTDVEPGSYNMSDNGVITYYLVPNVNCSNFTIVYNGNNDDGNTTMSLTHNVVENDTVNLAASNYIRAGYGFAGWSTVQLNPESSSFKTDLQTAVTAGKVYGPNETVTANAAFLSQAAPVNNTNTITFYAIWVKPEQNTATNQPMTLQEWTGTGACNAMSIGDVIALKDARDANVYAVAKLADSNCWMIENLRLDNTAAHNSDGTLAQGYNSSFIGLANPEVANFGAGSTVSNSLYSTDGSTVAPVITGSSTGYRFPRYNNQNTANPTADMNAWDNNSNIYSLGNYYTWAAAIADTSYYDTGNESVVNTSICPSGWHLPIGGSSANAANSEFWGLSVGVMGFAPANGSSYQDSEINIDGKTAAQVFRSYPNNMIYSGRFYNSAPLNRGSYGWYLSSTAYNSGNLYDLAFGGVYGVATIDGTGYKNIGLPVRCLATSTYTVSFDANGGTGTMGDQSILVGEATNLNSNTFTRSGYDFVGWNTVAGGSGTSYTDGQSVTDLTTARSTITLYAQWEEACGTNRICYSKNAASGVEGTMGKQTASASTDVTLLASNYSRSGYGFAGWNTAPDYSGTFYGPQEDITTPADMSNGLKLYAIWVASAGSMQTDATSVCNSLTTAPTNGTANLASVSALTDIRDSQTYAIAKLADGNCWMIENLRLESTAAHNSDGTLAQGYSTNATYGNFSGLADPETASKFSLTYSANSLYSNDGSNDTINIGTSDAAYRMPRYSNINTPTTTSDRPQNPTTNSATNSTSNAGMYSYGNYYTWHAAIADLNPNTINNQSTTSTSLCPSGWHLPVGGRKDNVTVSDFWKLSRATVGSDPANYANDYFY
ncbi:InlB B-repeat-containing protein [Candidatus Saccharibacteria bacterium]|nr:InlB B-repeat-containing protein [Candidatus Saccharibacteria bacterium]